MVRVISRRPLSARFAISSSGLRTSRSAGASMSAAVTGPGPRFSSRTSISGDSPCSRHVRLFRLRMMSMTSSRTPGQRRELVRDALDLHRGDRGALERGQKHAAKRVAERVAEPAVERLDDEPAALLVDLLARDPRDLEIHEAGSRSQSDSFLILASCPSQMAKRLPPAGSGAAAPTSNRARR